MTTADRRIISEALADPDKFTVIRLADGTVRLALNEWRMPIPADASVVTRLRQLRR
jgi:hypothetical protein